MKPLHVPPTASTPAKVVLVVEDNPLVLAITSEMVRELGHQVVEASSAEAAMALLPALRVDALIADIRLPGISGDVFAAQLRAVLPKAGIVFVSGAGRLKHVGRDGDEPMLLRKPYDVTALAAALDAALQRVAD